MQLRFAPLVFRSTGTKFNLSVSGILSGVTAVGTLTAVVLNSKLADSPIVDSLKPLQKLLTESSLYTGISKVGNTLKDWGASIVSSKDAFATWIQTYFNIHGLKAGVAQLYQKLKGWAEIVYNWFRYSFLEFINNIPKMVKNWDKLRLSLFKWGTFLGGGGGAALWAMFGGGENLDKLGDLLSNPDFADMAEKFSKLVTENNSAFADMSKEEAQDILEAMLEEPEEAKKSIEKLLEEQKEMNEGKPAENQEQPQEAQAEQEENKEKKELTKEQIMEEFSKGGSPKQPKAVFQKMLSGGMQKLVDLSTSFFGGNPEYIAKEALQNYVNALKEEDKKAGEAKTKSAKARKKFLQALENGKERTFIDALTKSFAKAYRKLEKEKGQTQKGFTFEEFSKKLGEVMEEDYTQECQECNEKNSISLKKEVPTKAPVKIKLKN